VSVRGARPVWALHVLVVGLALHNLVLSQLWHAGLHGSALSAVAAWKDVLVVGALAAVVLARGGLPWDGGWADRLALLFAGLVVLYGLIPQSALGGAATHRGVLYGARHDLLPVGAYFLGRGLELSGRELRALGRTVVLTAAGVAAYGLADVFLVPLSWWRRSGAPGWFHDQLGLTYRGLSYLPENFVYNAGNGVVYRRLVSTFLSPLATSFLLVVALLALVAAVTASPRRSRAMPGIGLLLFAALLWTHTKSALIALVAGLVVLALARRSALPLATALVAGAVGFAFIHEYRHVAPRTHFTAAELRYQEAQAHRAGPAGAISGNQAEHNEHVSSLREGIRRVVHHPQGFGLGNAGVTAARTGVAIEAGESTYTEVGVETGLLGALVFIAWSLVLFRRTLVRPWVAAAFAAVLVLGVQTDVIGVPWLAVVVWALAGSLVIPPRSLFGRE